MMPLMQPPPSPPPRLHHHSQRQAITVVVGSVGNVKKSAVLAALAAIDRRDGIDPESGSRWSLETVDADSKIAEQPTGTVRRGRSY